MVKGPSQARKFTNGGKNNGPHSDFDKMSYEHNKRGYRYYRHVSQKPHPSVTELLFPQHIVNSGQKGQCVNGYRNECYRNRNDKRKKKAYLVRRRCHFVLLLFVFLRWSRSERAC